MFQILTYEEFKKKEENKIVVMFPVLTSKLHQIAKMSRKVCDTLPYLLVGNGNVYITNLRHTLGVFKLGEADNKMMAIDVSDFRKAVKLLKGKETLFEITEEGVILSSLQGNSIKEPFIFLENVMPSCIPNITKVLNRKEDIRNYILVDKEELELSLTLFSEEVSLSYDKMLILKDSSKEIILFDTLLHKGDRDNYVAGRYLKGDFEIFFNPKLMLNILEALNPQNIKIGIIGKKDPIFLFSQEGEFILMPLDKEEI